MKPLVSILMPAFNAEKYINAAISSILNQTYTKFELLICDDASTDNTLEIIESFKDDRISVFKNKKNDGYLFACNKLFSKSKGDYITFQDADDWSNRDRIWRQLKFFCADPEIGICGTFAQYYDEKGLDKTFQKTFETSHESIKDNIVIKNQFCGASIMISKRVYLDIGGYRTFFNRIGNEDYDWSARIVERYKAVNIPEFLYNVRQSPNSITRKVRDPKQLVTEEIVRLLIDQRRKYKEDDLQTNNFDQIDNLVNEIMLTDKLDPSFILRKSADLAWYNRNMKNYWNNSVQAFMRRPFNILNLKYLIQASLRVFRYQLTVICLC